MVVATTCTVVVVQVIEPELEAVTDGRPVLGTTDTVPEAVQPLAGFVTVSTKEPGEQADAVYEVAPAHTPPVHTGVQVDGVAAPEMETVGEAQVMVCVGDTETVGVAVFWVTDTVAAPTQLFDVLVTEML